MPTSDSGNSVRRSHWDGVARGTQLAHRLPMETLLLLALLVPMLAASLLPRAASFLPGAVLLVVGAFWLMGAKPDDGGGIPVMSIPDAFLAGCTLAYGALCLVIAFARSWFGKVAEHVPLPVAVVHSGDVGAAGYSEPVDSTVVPGQASNSTSVLPSGRL